MDALERILRIGRVTELGWSGEEFAQAAREGKRRFEEIESVFEIEYGMFADAVALLAPNYHLAPEEETAVKAAPIRESHRASKRIALWYLKWERCPVTAGLPNPYEPWIEIMEHGGAFDVEHGQFVDVFTNRGMPVGCVVVRRA
jgi:hypothetical protein